MSSTISLGDAAKQAATRRRGVQVAERKEREEQRQAEEAERREQMTAPMIERVNEVLDAEWTWAVLAYDPQGRWAVLQEVTDPRVRLMVTDIGRGFSVAAVTESHNRLGTPWSGGKRIESLADLGEWLLDVEREERHKNAEGAVDG